MSRKTRLSIALAGVVAVVLAIDSGGWWFVTNRMEAEVADWKQAQSAAGFVVEAGPPRRGGWPFDAELILPAVTMATGTPGQPDAVAWQCDQVRLVYAPWMPEMLTLLVDGNQTVRLGAGPPVDVSVGRLDAHIPLDATGQAQGFAVAAREVAIPVPGGPVRIGALSVHVRQMDAFVSASDTTVPGPNLPFGGTIASVDFHVRSSGPIPFLRDVASALAAWRDHGQTLAIDDLVLRWGPLDVRGNGSLGLDAAMQPDGTAQVQLTGFMEVIEALARSGAITRNDARVAGTLLGLMSRPGASDVAEADLPLTLKDRTLLVGAIPVARVPVLVWP
jgi:hypothetical protein